MAQILIVDDSPSIRQTIVISLSDTGHTITEAVDGADGLEKAKAGRYDLIVTDLNMPNLDGLGMIRALRELPAYAGIPILFLSTESDAGIKQQAKAAGATGWLTKPFVAEQLIRIIEKVLAR